MKTRAPFATAALAAALLGGCGEGGDPSTGPFDLTLKSSDFGELDGRQVTAAVVLASDGTLAAGPTALGIAGGAFSVSWPGSVALGELYELHLFVDADDSGDCTAPPADPGWKLVLAPIGGYTTVTLHYTTLFTDVCATFAR